MASQDGPHSSKILNEMISFLWAGNLGVWVLNVALVWAPVTLSRLLALLWNYLPPMAGCLSLKLGGGGLA